MRPSIFAPTGITRCPSIVTGSLTFAVKGSPSTFKWVVIVWVRRQCRTDPAGMVIFSARAGRRLNETHNTSRLTDNKTRLTMIWIPPVGSTWPDPGALSSLVLDWVRSFLTARTLRDRLTFSASDTPGIRPHDAGPSGLNPAGHLKPYQLLELYLILLPHHNFFCSQYRAWLPTRHGACARRRLRDFDKIMFQKAGAYSPPCARAEAVSLAPLGVLMYPLIRSGCT